jgi:endonuclease III
MHLKEMSSRTVKSLESPRYIIPSLQNVLKSVEDKVDRRKLDQLARKLELALDSSPSVQLLDDPIIIRRKLVDYLRQQGVRPGMIQAIEQFYMGVIRRAALDGLIPAPPEGPWSRRWQSVLDAVDQTESARFLVRSLAAWATARSFEPDKLSLENLTMWAESSLMESSSVNTLQLILEKWRQDPRAFSLVSDSVHVERLRKKALRGSVRSTRSQSLICDADSEKEQRQLLYEVHYRLRNRYNTPDLGNVTDVFGEIVFAMLSTKTAAKNYKRAFSSLQRKFPKWKELANADVEEVGVLLEPCGLHNRKAKAIIAIARRVFVEEGLKDLEHLKRASTAEAEAYLTTLPEVGIKIAKCVCLYALNRPVFPLDNHNLRVLQRLGIASVQLSAREGAYSIESLIPEEIRHDLHVNLVAHGREACKSIPQCSTCVLLDLCPSSRRKESDS